MALSILSYNFKGFRNSCIYLKDIMVDQNPAVVCLQETWYLSNTASVSTNISDQYMFFETSGVDSSLKILTGRSYRGLEILFKRSLADKIRWVECANKRICAIRYHQDSEAPLLLINVYMTCDTQSIHCLNPMYSDTISDIEMLLFDHIGDVILCGDWNTDPSRDTAQSKCFESFLELPTCLLEPHFSDTTNDLYQWFAACNFVSRSFFNLNYNMVCSALFLQRALYTVHSTNNTHSRKPSFVITPPF